MEIPALAAEVFTIDFVPESGSEAGSSYAPKYGSGSVSTRTLTGSSQPGPSSHQSPSSLSVSSPSGSSLTTGIATAVSKTSAPSLPRRSGHRQLDQFIGDQSNRMVHWLWHQLQSGHFDQWPLTLYGPSGVGKSRLAARLALTVWEQTGSPTAGSKSAIPKTSGAMADRVLTVEAKDFQRSFRRAQEINSVADWRDRFQTAGVLLLDDLQHLMDSVDSQHEFCEILDLRMQRSLPTLVVSSMSPLSMGLNPALASRLGGGFCCGLNAAGRDALLAMIQKLFEIQNTAIEPSQAEALWNCGVSEIGLINQIVWRWKLERGNQPFQLERASDALKTMVGAASVPAVTADKVLRATAKQFDCTVKDLRGASRKSSLVRARGVFIWICRHHMNLSFKKIGVLLGNRDHTTIMNGLEKATAGMDGDPAISLATQRILLRLGLSDR